MEKFKISPEWLAGFMDGEGCFYIGKQMKNGKEYPKAQIILSQSGPVGYQILSEIQTEYGGNIYLHLKPGQHKAKKDAWKLWWNKDEGIPLITSLLPYLKIKHEEAAKVLAYLTRNDN